MPALRCTAAQVVLLGDMGAGKSSIALRFAKDTFNEYQESTIGAAFLTRTLEQGEGHPSVKFEMWDTAGQERYRSLAPMYYRGAAGALVVYDVTSEESFEQAKGWVEELKSKGSKGTAVCLVGNKCDLADRREVGESDARSYAEGNGLAFFETSAKSGSGILDCFVDLAKRLPRSSGPTAPQRQSGVVHVDRSGPSSSRAQASASSCCS